MSPFDSVDHHYARYRPRLPDQVVRLLAHETAGAEAPRLLDLGAGTGQVALSVLPVVLPTARLDLVDQDQDMLRTALDELRPHLGERTATVHAVEYGPDDVDRARLLAGPPVGEVELPYRLRVFAERAIGRIAQASEVSWVRTGSRVWKLTGPGGGEGSGIGYQWP
ncbi:class I SAM-dependent methyltransferase [Streptomyces sp. NBC_00273]|uniref:class I SAM-dependent methyltransferase n=1 Tax=Streptomyces sp. NBC_00273 TaxID=2903644 RepID=UPI002E2A62F8|nr:hypothetical protein [Streptomyces sp. NBC_00273]